MSAINIFLSPDRALVGVDTDVLQHGTGDHFEASKMIALPHAKVVIAARGTTIGFASVCAAAIQSVEIHDLDSAHAVIPGMLEAVFASLGQMFERAVAANPSVGAELLHEQQLVLVGWSQRRARVCAVEFKRTEGGAAFQEAWLDDPGFACPWEEGMEMPEAPPADVATQLALLQNQVRHIRRFHGHDKPIGGRLVVAEVLHESIQFSVHTLPPVKSRSINDLIVTERP